MIGSEVLGCGLGVWDVFKRLRAVDHRLQHSSWGSGLGCRV